jgi:O-antigen/teichoic acid export membrane protein
VPPTDRLPATSRWQTPVLWFRRGAWAFADQTLFAFSNFLLNVALARLLTPQDYGTFTIGYTIFLFVGTIYTSLLIEPLLVFGAGIYRDDLRTYVRALVRFHWRSTGIASVLLLAAGAGMRLRGHPGLGTALFALAVANPCILLQWLMRRACYVRFEPRLAAYAGIWYVVALFVGGGILERAGWLSAATGILLMGVGSLVSALWITSRLDIRPFTAGRSTVLAGLVTEHWRYGRWVVASSVLGWVPQSLYYLLLPLHAGLEGTAALKALMNLVMPVLHAYQPMLVLMVPALVRARGTPAFGRTVRTMLLLSTLCSGVYWLLLGVLDRPLVAWLYKGQYVADASLLWIIGLLAITGAAVAVLGSALRALERSNHIFAAYAASTLVTVTVGVWLMMNWNVKGAAIGVTLSGFTTTATMAWCLWRARAQPATSAAAA